MGEQSDGKGQLEEAKSWLHDLLEALIPALVIVLVVNVFLAQATRVEGQSMAPSLHPSERLIVEKISYRFHQPQRGDIVVLESPRRNSDPLIKRVIGLPGETIEIRGGAVFIDGTQLYEPYLTQPTVGDFSLQLIPEEHIFVMGDNRGSSNDSRAFGVVPLGDVIGRAWLRYWPPSEVGFMSAP